MCNIFTFSANFTWIRDQETTANYLTRHTLDKEAIRDRHLEWEMQICHYTRLYLKVPASLIGVQVSSSHKKVIT